MKRLVFGFLALAVTGPAAAAEVKAGDLIIRDPVIRAVAAGVANTAGYLTIANAGAKSDKLVSVTCACAKSVEVHLSHVMNGTAMMMPSAPVDVPAGGQVSFAPGGYHLMLVGLKAPLIEDKPQMLIMKFQHAGAVPVTFSVRTRIAVQATKP